MQLRIVSGTDVREAISMADAIDAMRHAFGALAAGEASVPRRVALETARGLTLFMPGYLESRNAAAAKIVSVFPGNVRRGLPTIHAVVLVLDAETGAPLALMDGTLLTALRTGAVGGLAADLLARPDAEVCALFGSGAQAWTQLQAVLEVRPIRDVRVHSPTPGHAHDFAVRAADRFGLRVRDTGVDEALDGADIVIAATTSRTPVFPGELLRPGMHVTGVGSFTPEMIELPAELPERAKVVVDGLDAAKEEAGELIRAAARGRWSWDAVHAELGDLLTGDRPARTSPEEITFFKSVGSAVQDVAVARRVLDAAEARGLGSVVDL